MKRRLLNVLMAVSLLLCVAGVALWARSHFVIDERACFTNVRARGADSLFVVSYAGTLAFCWDHYTFPPADRPHFIERANRGRVTSALVRSVSRYRDAEEYRQNRENFGLGWFESATEHQSGMWKTSGIACVRRQIRMPHGVVVAASLVCPAVVGWYRLHARRRRLCGHCRVCGYDLRATPGRCPECGTVGGAPGEPAG